MVTISESKEIVAPIDKLWSVVSDVDNEPQYWHGTKSVKNISKNGNVIDREVVISFKDSVCRETVTLEPKKSVEIKFLEGPMRGTKTLTLKPSGDNTIVYVVWEIKFAGFLGMFTGMVKKHIGEGTRDALDRIAKAVE